MRESLAAKKERTARILDVLKQLYPAPKCALVHRNAYELLVATILSAQCTDARVNMVTPALFEKYPGPKELALSHPKDVENFIQSAGFFRSKTESLRAAAADIVAKHGGEVPQTMDELTALRGVGRETANVVLGNAFGQNVGVVVDTHVGRLSLRLALTKHHDPVKVEQDLMKLVPQPEWTDFSHRLIFHGRETCFARKPACGRCKIFGECPSGKVFIRDGTAAPQ